ncbi:hypothetical protein ACHAP5_005855 [Fusarium lateritium]
MNLFQTTMRFFGTYGQGSGSTLDPLDELREVEKDMRILRAYLTVILADQKNQEHGRSNGADSDTVENMASGLRRKSFALQERRDLLVRQLANGKALPDCCQSLSNHVYRNHDSAILGWTMAKVK